MGGVIGRRAFLGWAATGAAGLLLPTIARPNAKVFDMGRWRGLYRPDPAIVAGQQLGVFASMRDGDWGDPATWGGRLVPGPNADVSIGHRVVADGTRIVLCTVGVRREGRFLAGHGTILTNNLFYYEACESIGLPRGASIPTPSCSAVPSSESMHRAAGAGVRL